MNILWRLLTISLIASLHWNTACYSEPSKPDLKAERDWIKKTMEGMSLKEKVAQLFILTVNGKVSKELWDSRAELIEQYQVGGAFWEQGDEWQMRNYNRIWQARHGIPLWIGASAEIDALPQISNLALGAVRDESLLQEWGETLGIEARRMGINTLGLSNLSIAVNLNNPILKDKTLGSIPSQVSKVASSLTQGIYRAGVTPLATGFPGEGDLIAEHGRQILDHGRARLDSVELYPYRSLLEQNLLLMQLGSFDLRGLSEAAPLPLSFSENVSKQLLRRELGFQGVIFSQPLHLLADHGANSGDTTNIYLRALRSGVDVLFSPPSLRGGLSAVLAAVAKGQFPKELIDQKVERILRAKYRAAMHIQPPPPSYLSQVEKDIVRQKLYEAAITVLKNSTELLPFKEIPESISVIDLHLSEEKPGQASKDLSQYIDRYAKTVPQRLLLAAGASPNYQSALKKAGASDYAIVGLHGMKEGTPGLPTSAIQFLRALSMQKEVIIVAMGAPYLLSELSFCPNLVCAYEDEPLMADVVSQLLFGAVAIKGKLPVPLSYSFPAGLGHEAPALQRLGYAPPEAVGVDGDLLTRKVDSLAKLAIERDATPGGQVLFAKNGKIIFEKSYGFYDYDREKEVTNESIYDLASLTKVLATLQAVMKLYGEGRFRPEHTIGDYLLEAKGTNKEGIRWEDVLTHQAGLQPFLPHYPRVLKEHPELLSDKKTSEFTITVARGIYAHHSLPDSLFKWTMESQMRYRRYRSSPYTYRYSDVGFYMLMWMVEAQTQQRLDQYVQSNFYDPLGLQTLGYHPLRRFSEERIVPTEFDRHFRNQILRGHVDDPGASLMGGVGGHAGVFGNARDVAVIMQMNLQDGYYGGKQYIAPGTIGRFNTQPFAESNDNRRALGWDKPTLKGHRGATSPYAPHKMYGHTGFTGTCAWVDPVNEIVYVFLANRINPYSRNKRFIREDYRELVMEAMYEAIGITEKRPER